MTTIQKILDKSAIENALDGIAKSIHKEFPDVTNLIVLGIRTRGAILSARLIKKLSALYGTEVSSGILDITLYRDDLSSLGPQPMVRDSEINEDISGKQIVLVDDVLYTGRTIRAAMDEVIDFGRPKMIRLAVLVDRGLQEYPIRADYVGESIKTTQDQHVQVSLEETDEQDEVILKPRKS